MLTLTNRQLAALSFWSGVDPRTVTRWYAGFAVRSESIDKLLAAVKKHELPLPAHLTSRAK
jgi:hypothetical protein